MLTVPTLDYKQWLRGTSSIFGLIALVASIWFFGAFLGIGTMRPLQSAYVRLALIVVIVLFAGGAWLFRRIQRRRAAKQIEDAISEPVEDSNDAVVLAEKMRDALTTLRQAKGSKGDYLYDIPWYILIGPPGAGKTTALVNSGLRFPLARGQTPAYVEGVGGTRYCDWWFTDEAVMIDTAGRYTTQDIDAKGDRKSWFAFLDLLKRNRPKQPINGALVAISLEDLLTLSPEQINAHGDAVRARLTELHDRLKIDFPVYALFTKTDLIAGFREYFGDLTEAERRAVWGATFRTDDKTRNMIGEVPTEFDALIQRLNASLADRLQEEPTHSARVKLFGFPAQMTALKRPIVEFLNRVFEPTRYHANATLRGFYFTSGTQQGTPIDRLIGAMASSLSGGEVASSAYSGMGKSFFLTDLLTKVVFGEAGWVSTNRAAARRAWLARTAVFVLIFIVAGTLAALWSISYFENRSLIAQADRAVGEYRQKALPLLQATTVSDHDLGRILQVLLHPLRHMPAGYEHRNDPVPMKETYGLSQHDRLESAAQSSYQYVLERTLRSRLILRLEEQLEAKIDDPAFVYEALKVYLMLGGLVQSDDELIVAWMRRDWSENLYPGAGNAGGRTALEEHLRAMLEMDAGRTPSIALNGPLVEEAQKTLARLSVAERAYVLLKSQSSATSFPDWIVADRGGPDMPLVFETVGGEDLSVLRVPSFFTYAGFHRAFLGRLGTIEQQMEREQWVLGQAGKQTAVTTQYATLSRDLIALYSREFIVAWTDALNKLQLRPMTADKPTYTALSAAAAATSPIRNLLESVRDETALTIERPDILGAPLEPAPATAVDPAAAAAAPALDTGAPAQEDIGQEPGAIIEAFFKPFHLLVEGEPGEQSIDVLIEKLAEIRDNLVAASVDQQQAAQLNTDLLAQINSLRADAARLPAPLSNMVLGAAEDIEGDVTGAAITQLSQEFHNRITQACQQRISNKYPFFAESGRDVALQDFGQLFAPDGVIDGFFRENLATYVDMSGQNWTWREDSLLARGLSAESLRQFQRAAEIRDAFFAGGDTLSVQFTVTLVSMGAAVEKAALKINAAVIESQQGDSNPSSVEWPGQSPDNLAGIALTSGLFESVTSMERRGPWALYRLLDAGRVLRQGDSVVANFTIEGEEISYEFTSNSGFNPLTMPALREFRCPSGL